MQSLTSAARGCRGSAMLVLVRHLVRHHMLHWRQRRRRLFLLGKWLLLLLLLLLLLCKRRGRRRGWWLHRSCAVSITDLDARVRTGCTARGEPVLRLGARLLQLSPFTGDRCVLRGQLWPVSLHL